MVSPRRDFSQGVPREAAQGLGGAQQMQHLCIVSVQPLIFAEHLSCLSYMSRSEPGLVPALNEMLSVILPPSETEAVSK